MTIIRFLFGFFRIDRTNWKVVVVCIFTAVVFWIFNALNKTYSTNISFPLLFEFNGEKYKPADRLPKSVMLNLSGNGWDLLRQEWGVKISPLIIPLEQPTKVKKIVGSSLIPVFTPQVGNSKINYIVTDTLHVRIDESDTHWFKLVADVSKVSFHKGYGRVSVPIVSPDSLKLDGAKSRLHALPSIIPIAVDAENVNSDFDEEVEVDFPGKAFTTANHSVVRVSFKVGEVFEVLKRLKVVADRNTKFYPDSVDVLLQIPIEEENKFNQVQHTIYPKVNARHLRYTKGLLPKVLNLPAYAQLLKVDSVYAKK